MSRKVHYTASEVEAYKRRVDSTYAAELQQAKLSMYEMGMNDGRRDLQRKLIELLNIKECGCGC